MQITVLACLCKHRQHSTFNTCCTRWFKQAALMTREARVRHWERNDTCLCFGAFCEQWARNNKLAFYCCLGGLPTHLQVKLICHHGRGFRWPLTRLYLCVCETLPMQPATLSAHKWINTHKVSQFRGCILQTFCPLYGVPIIRNLIFISRRRISPWTDKHSLPADDFKH